MLITWCCLDGIQLTWWMSRRDPVQKSINVLTLVNGVFDHITQTFAPVSLFKKKSLKTQITPGSMEIRIQNMQCL